MGFPLATFSLNLFISQLKLALETDCNEFAHTSRFPFVGAHAKRDHIRQIRGTFMKRLERKQLRIMKLEERAAVVRALENIVNLTKMKVSALRGNFANRPVLFVLGAMFCLVCVFVYIIL